MVKSWKSKAKEKYRIKKNKNPYPKRCQRFILVQLEKMECEVRMEIRNSNCLHELLFTQYYFIVVILIVVVVAVVHIFIVCTN